MINNFHKFFESKGKPSLKGDWRGVSRSVISEMTKKEISHEEIEDFFLDIIEDNDIKCIFSIKDYIGIKKGQGYPDTLNKKIQLFDKNCISFYQIMLQCKFSETYTPLKKIKIFEKYVLKINSSVSRIEKILNKKILFNNISFSNDSVVLNLIIQVLNIDSFSIFDDLDKKKIKKSDDVEVDTRRSGRQYKVVQSFSDKLKGNSVTNLFTVKDVNINKAVLVSNDKYPNLDRDEMIEKIFGSRYKVEKIKEGEYLVTLLIY